MTEVIAKNNPQIAALFFPKTSLNTETQNWLARASSYPDRNAILALDQFISELKRHGLWDKHLGIYTVVGNSAGDFLLNLKGTSFSSGTNNGGYTYLPQAEIRYNDAASSYTDLGLTPSTIGSGFAASSFFTWCMCTTNTSDADYAFAASQGGNLIGLRTRNVTSATVYGCNATGDTVKVSSGAGFHYIGRDNSSNFVYNNNGIDNTITRTVGSLPTSKLMLGRLGTGATYSNDGLAIFGFGATPLNADERANLNAASKEFVRNLGQIDIDSLTTGESIGANYFTPEMYSSISPVWKVLSQAAPPESNTVTNLDTGTTKGYPHFPCNYVATQNMDSLNISTWTGTHLTPNVPIYGCWFQWIGRANTGPTYNTSIFLFPSFNKTDGKKCELEFSSITKSDGYNLTCLAYVIGKDAVVGDGTGYQEIAVEHGFSPSDIILYADAVTNKDTLFTGTPTNGEANVRVTLDKIVLPYQKFTTASADMKKGIFVDIEVNDLRTSAQTTELFRRISDMCRPTYEVILYTNPLQKAGVRRHGLNKDNINFIANNYVDYFCIMAEENNAENNIVTSLQNQVDYFKGADGSLSVPYSKIMVTFQIGPYQDEMPVSDSQAIRNFMISNGITAINFWRYGGTAGGELSRGYNQAIAAVLGLPLT